MNILTLTPVHCVCVLLLLVLAGCQHKPAVQSDDQAGAPNIAWQSDVSSFPKQELLPRSLSTWQYSAKVGIKTVKGSDQANLVWRYHDQSNTVRLFGPLGVGSIKLEFDDYGVQLSDGKGVLHRGDSAQVLLTDIVGWPLPINALSNWLFAQPAPDQTFEYRFNQKGDVAGIRQSGWEISFDDYRIYAEQALPRKITATKNFASSQLGEVRVKLIAKNWQLNEAADRND